jgi:hypothetical protein
MALAISLKNFNKSSKDIDGCGFTILRKNFYRYTGKKLGELAIQALNAGKKNYSKNNNSKKALET